MGDVQGLDAPLVQQDNLASSANAPQAGERSPAMMERPQWVPEKFFKDGVINYRDMAKSYEELEKSKSQAPAPVDTPDPKAAVVEPPKPVPQVTAPPVVPGVTPERVTAFSQEIQKDGKLSEASYTELKALGYSKEAVDVYVQGLTQAKVVEQAVDEARIAQTEINSITDGVGGIEKFNEMLTWAKANMSPKDQAAYNAAVGSNDPAQVRMAVNGLHQSFAKVHGKSPNYVDVGGGLRPNSGAVAPYTSNDECAADMSTRLYKTSQAERDRVAAKLAVSNLFQQSKDYSKTER